MLCTKCGKERQKTEFYVRHSNGKLIMPCKACQHEYDKLRAKERSEKYKREVIDKRNEEKIRYNEQGQRLKQCSSCKAWKVMDVDFSRRENSLDGYKGVCKACTLIRQREYKNKLSDERREQLRREKIVYMQEYRQRNKDKINKKKRKESLSNSQVLNHNISSAIYRGLKVTKSDRHWEDIIGYDLEQLKEHLESQFDVNMTWDNIGVYWEIDHIVPQNTLPYASDIDKNFKICWSLMNLRPLTVTENRSRPKDGSDISEEIKQKILGQNL